MESGYGKQDTGKNKEGCRGLEKFLDEPNEMTLQRIGRSKVGGIPAQLKSHCWSASTGCVLLYGSHFWSNTFWAQLSHAQVCYTLSASCMPSVYSGEAVYAVGMADIVLPIDTFSKHFALGIFIVISFIPFWNRTGALNNSNKHIRYYTFHKLWTKQ